MEALSHSPDENHDMDTADENCNAIKALNNLHDSPLPMEKTSFSEPCMLDPANDMAMESLMEMKEEEKDDENGMTLEAVIQEFADNIGIGNGFQFSMDAFLSIPNPACEIPSDPFKDISIAVGKRFSDEKIEAFLINPWRPSPNFSFPDLGKNRTCRPQWFKNYPYLTFSYLQKGVYCMACAIRGNNRYHRPIRLVTEPLQDYSEFSKKVRRHAETQYHKENMEYITVRNPTWMIPPVIQLQPSD